MISWGGRFSAVLHAYGIFMFNFFKELIFNCVGHPGQKKSKEDYHKFLKVTNSSRDASDGRDH